MAKSETGVAMRVCAAKVLDAVFSGRSLTEALTKPCAESRDQPFVQALCYGVLREYPGNRLLLRRMLKKPFKRADSDIEMLLLSALYQIDHMRVPSHAAVNESVQAVRKMGKAWASGMVNALLRRYLREKEALNDRLSSDPEAQFHLPQWLLQRLQQAWPDHWQGIADAYTQQAGMILRTNLMKIDRKGYFEQLLQADIAAHRHPFVEEAVVLDKALPVEQVPGFTQGLVSVQDAGAQLAAALLDPQKGERLLDACAAPGGKSCHLLEHAGGALSLTAVDVDENRLQRVRENLDRLDLDARCVQGDAAAPKGEWAQSGYHRILLDAPCSATGVIRRHPDIKVLRRPDDISAMVDLQQCCLEGLWPLLRGGGMLLYATCSVLPEENEQQVGAFLARHSDAKEKPIAAEWGLERKHGRQTLPGEEGMDGFYYACLEKVIE